MKRTIGCIASLLLMLGVSGVQAQKLTVGSKAPELKIRGWVGEKPRTEEGAMFVEFFYSASKQCVENLDRLDALARTTPSVTFVVMTKEGAEKIGTIEALQERAFFVALDDGGKSFAAFDVNYVPFGVLLDRRGRVLWHGNSTELNEKLIKQYVK